MFHPDNELQAPYPYERQPETITEYMDQHPEVDWEDVEEQVRIFKWFLLGLLLIALILYALLQAAF